MASDLLVEILPPGHAIERFGSGGGTPDAAKRAKVAMRFASFKAHPVKKQVAGHVERHVEPLAGEAEHHSKHLAVHTLSDIALDLGCEILASVSPTLDGDTVRSAMQGGLAEVAETVAHPFLHHDEEDHDQDQEKKQQKASPFGGLFGKGGPTAGDAASFVVKNMAVPAAAPVTTAQGTVVG